MTGFDRFIGPCWRAVTAGREAAVLEGSVRTGRYNRSGEATLYMSNSEAGVAAAMARYGNANRSVVQLQARADRLVDLRDAGSCAALGVNPARVKDDWIAALDRGEEPASWAVSDRARAIGANGLIDASRRAPGEWHLVLFRWNEAGGASVRVVEGPSREIIL